MATTKRKSTARKNIKQATNTRKRKRTLAPLPKDTGTAVAEEAAKAVRRSRGAGRRAA